MGKSLLSMALVQTSVADPDLHGSAWTDADLDPGGKKPRKCTGSLGEYRNGRSKVRILL